MTPDAPKKNAPDPVRLEEANDGLDEFVAEYADGSPLMPPESRKSRAQRVQEPALLWSDQPIRRYEPDLDLPLRAEPVVAAGPLMTPAPVVAPQRVVPPELTVGVGLDHGWDAAVLFGWVRLAGRIAVVVLVLAMTTAGIVILRRSPAPSLADLSAPAVTIPPLDASAHPTAVTPPVVRASQPAGALTADRRTPPVSLKPVLAGPASGRTVPRVAPPVPARTDARRAGQQAPASPAPVVAWLRSDTEIRTAPATRADQPARAIASGAAPAASLAPAAPTASVAPAPPVSVAPVTQPAPVAPVPPIDVPPRAMAAAVPEAPTSAIAPPSTPSPATNSPNRVRAIPRAVPDAPSAVVAAPSKREVDTHAIEAVLGRYRNGFNSLSASSVSAVWPTVDEKNLAKAFERIEDQHVSFDSCEIDIGGVAAQANCRGTARYVPRVGSRTPRDEARRWTFNLRRASDGWVIDRVVAQ